jgi:hypothetical protein
MPDAPLPRAFMDRIDVTSMGVHSGLTVTLLPREQLAMGVNVANRGGHAHTRPPIRKMALTYAGGTQALATEALFQGAAFYASFDNDPSCIVASIGGRLFRYVVTNQNVAVDEITPYLSDGVTRDVNDPTAPVAWLAQGQDFLVVNNGQALPYFFDGAGVRRSQGPAGSELPAGRQLHYVNGRFVEVLPDGVSYIAGDLVYSRVSGTPAYNYRDSILKTTENESILAGAAFAVPLSAGPITALFSVAIPDTSLGQGPLQVATAEGVFSVNLPLNAVEWTTTQQPSQVVALPNGGPVGQNAVVTVNGDAWYRAGDGLRSFVVARRDFNTWVQTPLSFELDRVLPYDSQVWLPYASAVNFDNRLLCTCSPVKVLGRGTVHRGLVALDFNNVSSITVRSQPSYDGVWTGLPVLQVLKGKVGGVERCFIFALDAADKITLYELGREGGGWFDYNGEADVPIQSWIESGALFGRESDSARLTQALKKLSTGDVFLEHLIGPQSVTPPGTVSFNVQFRSDAYPCWQDWHEFTACAPSCYTPEGCAQPVQVREQYVTALRMPEVPDVCNDRTTRMHRSGYYFQVKFSWTGHAELHGFNFYATEVPAQRRLACEAGVCEVLACCEDSLFTYSIESPLACDLTIVQQPHVVAALEWDVDSDAPTWDVDAGSTITVPDE